MLEAAGIGPVDERIYLHLCAQRALTVEQLAGALVLPPDEVTTAVDRLRAEGLVFARRESPDLFTAVDPDLALDALVLRRRQALEQMRQVAREYTSRLRPADEDRTLDRLVHTVEDSAGLGAWSTNLQQNAKRDVLTVLGSATTWDGLSPTADAVAGLARGISYRCLYVQAAFEHGVADLADRLAAGERARVASDVPFSALVIDGATALLPLRTPGAPAGVVVREPTLAAALVAAAEMLWEQAVPISSSASRSSDRPAMHPTDLRLLSLMAAGLKDEVIARQLDVSSRTVLRRLEHVMQQLGATTRFQAGLQAARRGLVG